MNKFLQSYETDHAEPGDWDVKKITDCIESKRFQVRFKHVVSEQYLIDQVIFDCTRFMQMACVSI